MRCMMYGGFSNAGNSFRPTSSALYANSSRTRGRSRCAVLYKRRAYLSLYWISRIIMWSNVRRSGVVVAMVEALSTATCSTAPVFRQHYLVVCVPFRAANNGRTAETSASHSIDDGETVKPGLLFNHYFMNTHSKCCDELTLPSMREKKS